MTSCASTSATPLKTEEMNEHLILLTDRDKEKQEIIRRYWASRILCNLHLDYTWDDIREITGKTRQTWDNVANKGRRVCDAFIKKSTDSMREAGFFVPTEQIVFDFNKEVPVDSALVFKRQKNIDTTETETFANNALGLLIGERITLSQFEGFIEVIREIRKSK